MKIGILGGGQLAQMLALAGHNIGVDSLCFSESADVSAQYGSHLFLGDLSDQGDLKQFAEQVDVITLENEFIDTQVLDFLAQMKPTYPGSNALQVTQDRLLEKQYFEKLDIQCAEHMAIDNAEQLQAAAEQFGHQAILKTRRMGYDGKGQVVINSEVSEAANTLANSTACILEKMVPFDFEVSIVATRGIDGDIVYYPISKNEHREGILRTSTAPVNASSLQTLAEGYIKKLLEELHYVGTMAIEFFVINDQLIANEIAPRVHNSGHWTIEGTLTSQFENHMRAMAGLPLGATTLVAPCTMTNIIGEFPDKATLLKTPGVHLHDYCKAPRAGRKLGHTTKLDL